MDERESIDCNRLRAMGEVDCLEAGRRLTARGWRLATAESCTGGLLGGLITAVSGASAWYLGGVVAYAYSAKTALLDVPQELLLAHGAVSEEVVLAMARGAAKRLGAEVAVAVSGVAGPTGGTPQKPVGTVYVAWRSPTREFARRLQLSGGREAVRAQAVREAVAGLLELLTPAGQLTA